MKDMDTVAELPDLPSPRKNLRKRMVRQGSVSENYFAIPDAALILPRQATLAPIDLIEVKKLSHIQNHLHAIFDCLREQDSVKLAVRLESWQEEHIRYLVIVSTLGRQDTEESIVVGMDFEDVDSTSCTIGLVLPIWRDTVVNLDGDGDMKFMFHKTLTQNIFSGFKVVSHEQPITFKPVSVQAMWSALQSLHKCVDIAMRYNYFRGSLFLTWVSYYESHVNSNRLHMNEWEYIDEIWSRRRNYFTKASEDHLLVEQRIRSNLKEVMMQMDLDNSTSRHIRMGLEARMGEDLSKYKKYIDEEMLVILGQMECASKILDFLYLGSEWNSNNFDELKEKGITHILNVTKEIDEFFPDDFIYKRVSLFDVEESDLLPHWNDTWRFIDKCRKYGGKCLVHCKMGISRSSATVTAFLMKDNLWKRDVALKYVKERRGIIRPNPGFMNQLHEYEGIIFASAQRHNKLFRSRSESNLIESSSENKSMKQGSEENNNLPQFDLHRHLLDIATMQKSYYPSRPKSWSAGDTQYYYNDSVTIGPWSVVSNNTEVTDMPIDRTTIKTEIEEGPKVSRPRYRSKKKFNRRHTEVLLPRQQEILYSEDSLFVNHGEMSMNNHMASEPEKSPKRQISSPAVLETLGEEEASRMELDIKSSDSANVESNADVSEFVDTSPTIESVKNIVARIDSSEPEPVEHNNKGHKKALSSTALLDLEMCDPGDMKRNRSFSETSSVKTIVNKIETQYSASPTENINVQSSVTVTRSQSMPSGHSRHRKTPPLKTLPSIESTSDEQALAEQGTSNANANNNNNSDVFYSLSHEFDQKPVKIYEKDPMDFAIRTLTQDELRVIREVGQTLLSDTLSQEGSSDVSTNEQELKKRGIVRQMAKEIEKNFHKVIDNMPLNKKTKHDTGAIGHVNKLLMGQISPTMSKKYLFGNVKKPKFQRNSSSPNISSLFAPKPYRTRENVFKKVKNRRNSDVTKVTTITRSQSERIGLRTPRVSFRNKVKQALSSRNSFSESELNDLTSGEIEEFTCTVALKSSRSAPQIEAEESIEAIPSSVQEMIENIERKKSKQRIPSTPNSLISDA